MVEAKASVKRAGETVLQGRSIIVFTVVTIFFVGGLVFPGNISTYPMLTVHQLPLSFVASLFGMNAHELNGDSSPMRLGTEIAYMCKWALADRTVTRLTYPSGPVGCSSIIILVTLTFAFSAWARTAVSVPYRILLEYAARKEDPRLASLRFRYRTSGLRDFERRQVSDIRRQALSERLRRIKESTGPCIGV